MSNGITYTSRCPTCEQHMDREFLHILKGILHPCVHGALIDTIRIHGPINEQWLGSASKRVVGAVLTKLYELDSGVARITKIAKKHQTLEENEGG